MSNVLTRIFSPTCPHCKSIEFRGVGIRNATEAFFAKWLYPYRCSLCGRHFFLFRGQAPQAGT
jgi:transposase-like protein